MFIVTVVLRQSPTTLQFMFKDFKGAMVFKNAIHERRRKTETDEAMPEDAWSLDLTDDYGHIFDAMIEEVGALVVKDVTRSNAAMQEIAMAGQKAQLELQQKIKADPTLRFLGGNIQLPAM